MGATGSFIVDDRGGRSIARMPTMSHSSPGRAPRRLPLRPSAEPLESRLVLSTLPAGPASASMTLALAPRASGLIGPVATGPKLVFVGQTMPGATVTINLGDHSTGQTRADRSGHYRLGMAMPTGTYTVRALAENRAGAVATASMTATRGDAVVAWVDTMLAALRADPSNVGLVTRTMAMTSAAVYDAVNDIHRTGAVFRVDVKAPGGASASAAAAEAAYTVLRGTLGPSTRPMLDAAMAQSLAAVPAGSGRAAGVAVGRKVGQGILAWRANDGSQALVPYVVGSSPGQWRPTPPDYIVAWGPEWGRVKPFVIASPAAYVPPPPPPLNSTEYAAALNQVESLGAANSTTRTPDQTQAALFWSYDLPASGTPPTFYDEIAAGIALQRHNTLDQNARMFGLVNLAMGDAGITAWDAKFTYNLWRPITAIRLANTDGNPATAADPTWTPLGAPNAPGQPPYTPPFPAYMSGHATFGSTLFTTLANFYGTDQIPFSASSVDVPGVARSFPSLGAASLENAWSRIYLGVHYSFDATAGLATGQAVGNAVFARALAPNPAHAR